MAKTRKTVWDEPLLVEYTVLVGKTRKAVTARMGIPYQTNEVPGWACAFQLAGVGDDAIHLALGRHGLQATLIAATALRRWLDKRRRWMIPGPLPYEAVFPRVLPWADGLDFHWELCDWLDAAIDKKQRQFTRQRLKEDKARRTRKL